MKEPLYSYVLDVDEIIEKTKMQLHLNGEITDEDLRTRLYLIIEESIPNYLAGRLVHKIKELQGW